MTVRDIEEGEAKYSEGQYEEALKIARAQSKEGWKSLGLEGRCLLRLKRYEEAIATLEKACTHDPPVDVWLNLSSALAAVKRYDRAYALLERTETAYPGPRLLISKAKVLKKWGKKNLALSVCQDITSRHPLHLEAWEMSLSLSEATGNQYVRHRAACSILELEGEHVRALKAAAECRLAEKDLNGAKTAASEYVVLEPKKPLGWLLLSDIAHRMADHEKALAYVDRALHLNPKYHRAWIQRSILMITKEDDKEAKRSFENAWELNSSITKKMCIENPSISHLLGSRI